MSTLLKAEHHSWEELTRYDWSSNLFELTYEGDLHVIVKYYEVVLDCVVEISESDLSRIINLIPDEPISLVIDADDGDAWEFKAFDKDGEISFQRDMDYIYGIDALEKIGEILESYIPEYDVPGYDDLDS